MPRYPDDDSDDDIDRDPDERYRRRVDRYGPEFTEEEEEEEERIDEESARKAQRKCLLPGLLMTAGGVLTVLGGAAFFAYQVGATGAAGGGAPGAFTVVSLGICAGIPLLFVVAFCAFQVAGGIALLRQRARGLAVAGGIMGALSLVPLGYVAYMCNFPPALWLPVAPALLGVVAVVWLMVLLNDVDVQAAFERR